MAAENLGELSASVKMTADTSAVESAIVEITNKTKKQLEGLGGTTLTQLTENFKGFSSTVTGGLEAINASIAKVQNVASLGFLGVGLGNFVKQVFDTRSYFQDAASSMKTFLGDAEKGAKFTKELQDYAFYNMYEFQDLVGASKQLIAYGTTEGKEIITVIDQLSNIATGTGADLNSMIDIYNKVKASGTANGIVLDQLASRGLLVKKTLQDMGETVNGNKVTFEQFQKVLAHVTAEGGMFHDLMKDQLNNLSASSAQLSDNLTAMYNEIGEKAEPYMKQAIDFASMLVENYQEVASVLFDLVKAYGIYKLATKVQDFNTASLEKERVENFEKEKAALEDLKEAKEEDKNADLKARVAKGLLTEEQAKEIALIREAVEEREKELSAIKSQAETEVAETEAKIKANEKEISSIQAKIKQLKALQEVGEDNNNASNIAELQAQEAKLVVTNNETLAKQKESAAERANAAEKQLNTIATGKAAAAEMANAKATTFATRAKIAAQSALKGIAGSITSMINPAALATAAVGFLATKVYELATAETALEKAQKQSAEIQAEYSANVAKEQAKIDELFGTLDAACKGYGNLAEAQKAIMDNYGQYISNLNLELNNLNDIEKAYKAITSAMVERYKAEALAKAQSQHIEQLGEADKNLYSGFIEKIDKDSNVRENTELKKALPTFLQEYEQLYFVKLKELDKIKTDYSESARARRSAAEEQQKIVKAFYKKWGKEVKALDNRGIDTSDISKAVQKRQDEINAANLTWENNQILYANKWKELTKQLGLDENGKPLEGTSNKTNKVTDLKKTKDLDKKFVEEYAKLAEDRNKKIQDIDKKYNMSSEEKNMRKKQIEDKFSYDLQVLEKGSNLDYSVKLKDGTKKTRYKQLEDLYDEAAKTEIEIAKEQALKIKKEITKIENNRTDINNKKGKNGQDLTPDQVKANTAAYNAESAKIANLTAQLKAYDATIQKSFESSTFEEKTTAYTKFAKEYTQSLIAVKEKEIETKEKLAELEKQAKKTLDPRQQEEILRQKENEKIELENFKADEEMKREILVQAFDSTATDITSLINNMMMEVEKISLDTIRNEIVKANKSLQQLKVRAALGEDVSTEIAKTESQILALDSALKKLEKEQQKVKNNQAIQLWKQSKQAVGQLANSFKDLGSAVGGSTEEVMNMASNILATTVSLIDNIVTFSTTSIQAIQTAETAGVAAVKAVEAASVILAVISAVIQLGTAIANLFSAGNPVEELKDSLHDFNLELEETKRLAAQELTFAPFETIFGNDQWGSMLNNIRIGEEAYERLGETQQDIIKNMKTMGNGYNDNYVAEILSGGLFHPSTIKTSTGQYNNVDDTVANMYVKVKHKTWFTKEKGTTLKDLVPSLFDDAGKLDYNALHKFVESGNDAFDKLSDANQEYLKKMDESWQEYQESVKAVKDTFSNFFGDLGSQIQDVWTNAFRAGENGLADFEKSWDSAIENMIQSMAYSKTLGKVMDDMENDLDKMGFFEDPEGHMDEAISIMESYETKAQNSKEAYDAILQKYREKGYFKEEEKERQGVTGGIANVTQDTAEEMNGRLTQIQSHTFAICENMKNMVQMQQTQLTILQGIHTDTGQLHAIRADIEVLKTSVSDIQIKGIKLKN